jgi:hypothetical protein
MNEPAFPSGLIDPSTPDDAVQSLHKGMTLRDYFAAKAMSEMTWRTKSGSAKECYEMADAMMEARNVAQ